MVLRSGLPHINSGLEGIRQLHNHCTVAPNLTIKPFIINQLARSIGALLVRRLKVRVLYGALSFFLLYLSRGDAALGLLKQLDLPFQAIVLEVG
jgi:hypothetical protein